MPREIHDFQIGMKLLRSVVCAYRLSASDGTSKCIYFMQIECEKKSFIPHGPKENQQKFTLKPPGHALQMILWLKGQS